MLSQVGSANVAARVAHSRSCGTSYRFTPTQPAFSSAPDGVVVRYGHTAGEQGAPDTEAAVQWSAIRGQNMVSLSITAIAERACLPRTSSATTLALLSAARAVLDTAIATNGMPAEVAPT